MAPRSRGMTCPSFDLCSPRREGAGNAGCTLHPRSRVQWVDGSAHEHTGSAEALRHSLRNGFTAYTCSSRRRIPFATVASGLRFVQARSGRRVSAGLTSATDARTTRLRRTQRPHPPLRSARCRCEVLAKALKRRSSARRRNRSRENPPCNHDRARRRCVHRIQPRVRDDRDTPLLPGWTGGVIAVIWVKVEAVYF